MQLMAASSAQSIPPEVRCDKLAAHPELTHPPQRPRFGPERRVA
jgi:hypothetical protein